MRKSSSHFALRGLLAVLLIAGISSCSSDPQDQFKKEVKKHLKEKYPSYQPEQIAIVDTVYRPFEKTSFYQEAEDQLLRLEGDSAAKANMMQNELGDPVALQNKMDSIEERLSSVRQKLHQRRQKFQPRPMHYVVEHRFVARKEDGEMLDGHFRLKVDTNAQVVEMEPMAQEQPSQEGS